MRKMKMYMMTAAALTLSGLMSATAFGGQGFRWPAQQQAVAIGGNCGWNLKEVLEQLKENGLWTNCIPGFPDISWPEDSLPGNPETGRPDTPETDHPILPEIPEETPDQENQGDFAAQVVSLVNRERESAGLSPLTIDRNVSQAAAVRAGEIQTSFSHTRPDGSSFSTALTQAGVSFRSSGENIAYGQKTPQEVMEGWMNSSGHRANILNPDFTAIGVGYTVNAGGTPYWVQLFTR